MGKMEPIKNLYKAGKAQPSPFKWFVDGFSKIIKCVEGKTIYTDGDIRKNRDVCRKCEYASLEDGKLTLKSQCMYVDPETGAPCGCFLVCKTQTDKCPASKWDTTPITIGSTDSV